jgi:hypothetical protein
MASCYREDSTDGRCCGLCCRARQKGERCEMCPETLNEFFSSGYFLTVVSGRAAGESNIDYYCCATALCCPVKFPLFFPCLLGSGINHCLNRFVCCRKSDKYLNYLW